MASQTFQETSRFPRFILILLVFHCIIMSFILTRMDEFSMIIVYITVPLLLLFIFSFLKLNLNKNYFEYSFFPFTLKTKRIQWDEIQEVQIVKTDPIFDFGGWGVRLSKKYGTAYIGNNEIIFLKLKNGKRRSFSIKNKEALVEFLDSNGISYC